MPRRLPAWRTIAPLGTLLVLVACGDPHAGAPAARVSAAAEQLVAWLGAVSGAPAGEPAPGAGPSAVPPSAGAAPSAAPGSSAAAASADRETDAEPAAAYYRYEEPGGSVRFVSSLEEVPPAARERAERIAIASRPAPASRPPAASAPQPRPWARTASAPAPRAAQRAEVVVYTTSWCGWCRRTLAWLDARGVDYENRDIESNPAWRRELLEKTGRASIPVVDVGGRIVRGFDEAALDALL